jgi:hypothetical protein
LSLVVLGQDLDASLLEHLYTFQSLKHLRISRLADKIDASLIKLLDSVSLHTLALNNFSSFNDLTEKKVLEALDTKLDTLRIEVSFRGFNEVAVYKEILRFLRFLGKANITLNIHVMLDLDAYNSVYLSLYELEEEELDDRNASGLPQDLDDFADNFALCSSNWPKQTKMRVGFYRGGFKDNNWSLL